jgi:hypothetical protein
MKHLSLIIVLTTLSLTACARTPIPNPDPNHTHADFAVWIDGKKLDFSGTEFMSGSQHENDPDHEKHHKYLHLHDGNGHVIHRHKPGLTLQDFFASLQVGFSGNCFSSGLPGADKEICSAHPFRFFVNGTEKSSFDDLSYVFVDGDKILLTNAVDNAEVQKELSLMTDDSCMYSKTCPWKGDPPTENCIADPEVPCSQ